jgi:hypothetical protein
MMLRIFVLGWLLVAASVHAGKLYKWVDDKGITHYGDKIPPEFANKKNEELNSRGTVVRRNAGALTPEQRQAREEELAKQRDAQRLLQEQRRKDRALFATYSSVEDIDRAKKRSESAVLATIGDEENRMSTVLTKRKKLEADLAAANAAKKPTTALSKQLAAIDLELKGSQDLIAAKRKELETVRQNYDAEKARFIEIRAASPVANR